MLLLTTNYLHLFCKRKEKHLFGRYSTKHFSTLMYVESQLRMHVKYYVVFISMIKNKYSFWNIGFKYYVCIYSLRKVSIVYMQAKCSKNFNVALAPILILFFEKRQ